MYYLCPFAQIPSDICPASTFDPLWVHLTRAYARGLRSRQLAAGALSATFNLYTLCLMCALHVFEKRAFSVITTTTRRGATAVCLCSLHSNRIEMRSRVCRRRSAVRSARAVVCSSRDINRGGRCRLTATINLCEHRTTERLQIEHNAFGFYRAITITICT